MTVTYTSLIDLSPQQLDKILDRFQLICRHHDAAQKIQIIKCVALFDSKLGDVPEEDVLVGFNKSGNLHDIKSRDDTIKLMDEESLCNMCSKKVDKKDVGLRCNGCSLFFHNKCTNSPVPVALFNHIVSTPDWVKVFCPKCLNASKKAEENTTEIKQDIKEIKEKMTANRSYGEVAKQLESNTKAVMKSIANIKEGSNPKTDKEKKQRERIVRKPSDKKIRNSSFIRATINKEFPGVVIRECRPTAAGSVYVEFDTKEDAENIQARWKKEMFGGNEGMFKIETTKNIGIVKNIIIGDEDEEEIKDDIEQNYPGAKTELFKRPDGRFMGTLKIKFTDEKQLQKVVSDRFKLFRQRYIVEQYQPKPKVIKCNRCQMFGHISRLCNMKTPKCGNCSSERHESKDCEVTAEYYKCAHCSGNHCTGSKECEIWKSKEEALAQNYQYGQ